MRCTVSTISKFLPESVAYFLRRARFMVLQRDKYLKFTKLRKDISENGYSLAQFDEYQCIFIHIPKCAGQSVRATLFGNLQPGHINVYTYQQIYPKRIFDRYYKFTFVRNPWDRLVSAYFFMKAGGAHQKDRDWSQKHLSPYPDFASFVREGLRNENILHWPHFRPQVEFLKGQQGRIEIDFIGRFENIQEDFQKVASHLGISRELLYINKAKKKRDPYQTYYTAELRYIAGDVYREDITTFDYQF